MNIKKDPRNLNIGTERGRRVTEQSFERLGAGRSVLIDKDGTVIAGNKSLDAFAKTLGREPVIVKMGEEGWEEADIIVVSSEGDKLIAVQRDDLDLESEDDSRAREMGIADNRAAQLGLKWSMDDLRQDFEDGKVDWMFTRAEKVKMDEENAKDILRSRRDLQDRAKLDNLDEVQERWKTDAGQVWGLGNHVMIIGSSTDVGVSDAQFLDLSRGEKANMLFTSPPYWIGKDYEVERTYEEIDAFIAGLATVAEKIVSKDFGRVVINTGLGALHRNNPSLPMEYDLLIHRYAQAFKEHGWYVRHVRIYTKLGGVIRPSFGIVRSPVADVVLPAFEYITYLTNSEATPEFLLTMYNPDGENRGANKIPDAWIYRTVWDDININRAAEGLHIAGMPLEVAERYVKSYTLPGELIVEPFLGSGTTILAAEKYGRRVIGWELDPKYASACLERYSIATGDQPELL